MFEASRLLANQWSARPVAASYVSFRKPVRKPVLAPDKPDDFFAKPSAIAEEMYHVAHQDRSAWSFLVELRPFGEVW